METNTLKSNAKIYLVLVLFICFGVTSLNAQITNIVDESDGVTSTSGATPCASIGGCSANSVEILGAYLGNGSDGTAILECSDIINVNDVWVYIIVDRNGLKESFFAQFDLYTEGVYATTYEVTKPGQVIDGLYKAANVPYNCGLEFELRDLLVTWSNGAPPGCPTDDNYAQCNGNIPNILVDGPLFANFSYSFVCNSTYDVIITSETTGGRIHNPVTFANIPNPYQYTLDYGDGTIITTGFEPSDYVFLPAHTYAINQVYTVTLTVEDTIGIIDTYSQTVGPFAESLTISEIITNNNCNNGNAGAIDITVDNGTSPYTYNWTQSNGGFGVVANSEDQTGLSIGEYLVTVTDANGCQISGNYSLTATDNDTPTINAPSIINVEGCGPNDITNGDLTTFVFSPSLVTITEIQFLAEGGTFNELSDFVITYQDTVTGTCSYVVTRLYTITDVCNNSASISQTININDSTDPTWTNAPEDATVECDGTPDPSGAFAAWLTSFSGTDACGTASVTNNSTGLSDLCGATGSETVTFTLTDLCGNFITQSATFTIQDNTNPTWTNAPADATVDCDGTSDPSGAFAAWLTSFSGTDACGTASVTNNSTGLSDLCGATGSETVIFTLTDLCGNFITQSATFTIQDNTNPTWTNAPADATVECDGTPDPSGAFAAWLTSFSGTDACGTASVTNNSTGLSDLCGATGSETVTFTLTDLCGNFITQSATFTIQDNTNPTWTNAPADATVDCNGTPDPNSAFAAWLTSFSGTDTCGTASVTNNSTGLSDLCGATGSETIITFTLTDLCGNFITQSATFTIQDNTNPTWTNVPADATVECDGTSDPSGAFAAWLTSFSGTDACGTASVTNNSTGLSDLCGATGSETVTFTLTDLCGNFITQSATFTIQDNTNPTWTNAPADATVDCDGTPDPSGAFAAWLTSFSGTDTCGTASVTNNSTGLSDLCGATGSETVTFTLTDLCGNFITQSATFTIQDNTNPTWTNAPADATVDCDGTSDPSGAFAAWLTSFSGTDACGTASVTNNSTGLSDLCGATGSETVTFTLTDLCGNFITQSATFTIQDNTNPTWTNAPADATVDCDGTSDPSGAFAAWLTSFSGTDTCGTASVTNNSTGLSDLCGATGSETVTFTLTDLCGNFITQSATFTIQDNTNPTWTNAPADATVECDGTSDPSGAFAAWLTSFSGTDACGTASVTNNSTGLSDLCGATGLETVIFTLTDLCGNFTTQSATFTIQDLTAPDLSNCSVSNLSVECTANDNETIADEWDAANIAELETCGLDACDIDAVFTVTSDYDFNNLNTACGPCGNITVNYIVADDCGNESIISATLSFGDTTGPDLANCDVTDGTIECNGTDNETIADEWNASNIVELDACADDINVTITSDYAFTNLSSTCGAGGTITVIYTVTDDCDNASTLTATLTLEDSTGPDLSNCSVTDETIECNGTENETIADAWDAANILALQTCGTDSCDTDAIFTVTSDYAFANLVTTCGASGTITVTYTVSDDCDNASTLTATLTLEDSTGPDLSNCTVTDETIECNGTENETIADDWDAANILALQTCGTDSCDTDAIFTVTSDYAFANLVTTCGASGTITVTYTVSDDCDNASTLIATLTLEDSTGPNLTNCTVTDETIECTANDNETIADEWDAANIAELETCGIDSCDVDAVFTVTSDYDFNNLNTACGPCGNITVNYIVADDCGNESTISATLSFGDTTGPDLANCDVTDETIECNGSDNEAIADAWDAANINELEACADDINVTITSDYAFTNLSSTCGAGGTITVIYTVTDDCDNASTLTATLTLEDSTGPDLSNCSVTDETIECNGTENETIADAWDAANILVLQTCGTDSCDTDAIFTVTSDYAFANLVTTCGAGATITVTYTVSDDCDNASTLTATLTLEDSTGPDLANCTVTDETIECNGTENETIADAWDAANILALQTCGTDSCDTDAIFTVTSDYAFANLVTTCGVGGTITVTYTVSDDCDNASTLIATLTLEDSTGPNLTNCTVTDETIECTANDNETIADEWDAANIAELETCGIDSCDVDAVFTVTSDYDFNNLNTACGPCGNITVNYIVADDCGNESTISATLSFGDTTGPDLANCDVTDETIECNGSDNEAIADAWDTANINELEACADDINVTITSDYAFTNLGSTCGAGGTITVIYTATDDCDNASTLIATLTLEDSTGPDLSNCTVTDETIECNGTENETIADDWDAANILALQTCGTDACDTDAAFDVTSDYAFTNLESTCGAGGTITVTYTVSDDCENETILTAILTLEDSTPSDLSNCSVIDQTIECNGSDNQAIADAWDVDNIAALETCGTDDCDVDATYTVTSDYDFSNLDTSNACGAGGSLAVTYTVADDCGNEATITVTLTLEDTTPPDLSVCSEVTDETIECNGSDNEAIADAWNQGNIDELTVCPSDDCVVDATYTVTSDYDFNNLDTSNACGAGGSLAVTYTVADDCGNEATITVTLTLEDTTPPDLSVCSEVTDETIECNGSDNEAIADAWNQGNIDELTVCPSDDCDVDATYTVTSDYAFANLVTTCGLSGTITVTYTVSDDCGNSATLMATLTLEDTTPPDLSSCNVISETVECDGDNNESIADQWNADNIAALEACTTDSCDTDFNGQVTSDYSYSNIVTTCGLAGSITAVYTITDDCGNPSTISVTLTIEDNTVPDLSGCNVTDQILECDGDNNEAIADQWNADNIAALEACAADSCDADFTGQVTSDYDFSNLTSAPGLGGILDVEYTISDDCGNVITLYAMMTLQNTSVSAFDIALCNVSTDEAQIFDLFDLLDGYYDDGGTWEVIDGDATIDGNLFDPLSVDLGFYSFSYTENDSACPTYVEVTVEVHDRCFVLSCSLDNVVISKAVTPNGDQYNEFFEVTGIELCGYTIDVKMFNRWGALIYESRDYQNDWRGTAHNNSIGGADTVPDGTYFYIVTLKDSGIDPINGYIYVGTK